MEWILIIVFSTSGYTNNSKVITTTSIQGFHSEKACNDAGMKATGLSNDTRFVCVQK